MNANTPVAWMPLALTLNAALDRGEDPAMLLDENSPLRDELRRLIAAERARPEAQPESVAFQYLRESVSKQMEPVRAALADVVPLPPPKSYPRLGELAGEIRAVIDKHVGELPLASVLGVLEIVKARLIAENTAA